MRPFAFFAYFPLCCFHISFSHGFLWIRPPHIPGIRLHAASGPRDIDGLSVGFLGCGTIASAIATGLATQDAIPITSISVSKRSPSKSSALESQFSDLVNVYDDNQEILNRADLIFLCVLPKLATEVLQSLSFDPNRHTLVSLVSTANLETLIQDSKLDPSQVWKMLCLPSVAQQRGACLVCPTPPPPDHDTTTTVPLYQLLETLGGCIPCDTEPLLEAAMLSTCLMGPLYGVMRRNRDWLVARGLPSDRADRLIRQQYLGAIAHAAEPNHAHWNLDALVNEQTPGGLNEQALRELEERGVLEAFDQVMDSVYKRIRGRP